MSGFNCEYPEANIFDLVERGLIEKVYDPVKGEMVYELTEKGKQLSTSLGMPIPF